MEHISLYRRFRPNGFDRVIGQQHIVRTLTNQIKNGRIGHAYLFTGTRGTGKTSCAKIFARAVNCLQPIEGSPCGTCEVCRALADGGTIDVIEIDAASNNGVDEIRELKENAQYRPSTGKYKVYIIDEVHMLTASAFNALLKTLEEPPSHVIFILATTEVQKLPQTILSRCMRFDFRLVERDELVMLLKRIYDELGVNYEEKALIKIAEGGEGSVRDTLSLADMCLSYGGDSIKYEDVLEILCATDFDTMDGLGGAILEGRTGDALQLAERLLGAGRNTLSRDLTRYFMDILRIKNVPGDLENLSERENKILRQRGEAHSDYRIARVIDLTAGLENATRYSTQPKILIQAAIVRACELVTELNLDGLTARITELEKRLRTVEQDGVKIVTTTEQGTAPQRTAKEAPVPSTPREDLNALLSEIADADAEIVFEEEQEASEDDTAAAELWSKLVAKLEERKELMLKMAASCIESGFRIVNSEFILETDDNMTLALFNREVQHKTLQNILREESGKELKFTCVKPSIKNSALSSEDKLTLDRLFNGEVKIKKKPYSK